MALRKKIPGRLFRPLIFFSLFQKNSDGRFDRTEKLKDESTVDFSRIRCPLCRWRPQASSLWYCADAGYPHFFYHGCGTAWNTFETRGRCPGCGHQWLWTDCLRCGGSSPHEAWYETGETGEK